MATDSESANAFIGRAERPTEEDLENVLGPAKAAWDRLIDGMAVQHQVTIQEWNCYSRKAGWSLRLKRGKRAILWLAPCAGCFRVAVILGDKARLAARQGRISARAVQALDQAQRYPEGTGVRLLIKTPVDLPARMKLAAAKLEN